MAQSETEDKNDNIKILSVVWYKVLPPEYGGQKAVALFNEHLAFHAPLLCLCSENNEVLGTVYNIQNELPKSQWQFLNPLTWRKIYATAKQNCITHLILEFPYHGIAGFICKKLLGIRWITNTHNIEFLRFREQKKWWWRLLFYFEKWALKKSDLVFFKTAADMHLAKRYFDLPDERAYLIPCGVSKKASLPKEKAQQIIRQRYNLSASENILLFAGTLDYAPNAEAVGFINKQIIPLLNETSTSYRIIVCGRNRLKQYDFLNNLANERLIMAGEVRDIDLYFSAADVFINPVITGGGMQTKIMDALSYNLNVVCFATKSAGISNTGRKIFVAEDKNWAEFVSLIFRAAQERSAIPPSFYETYNWRIIASDAYQKIVSA